jgi:thiol-disulfide isomerase/thioredoxin
MAKRNICLASAAMAVVFALLLVTGCGGTSGANPKPSGSADVSLVAPAEFALADYAGKPVVLNFFGSWCAPCRMEAPALSEFAAAHPEVTVIAVAYNDDEESAVAFLQEFSLSVPLVVDDYTVSSQLGVNAVPTTIFFTSDGKQATTIVGASTRERLEEGLAMAR